MKYINVSIHDLTKSTIPQVKRLVGVLSDEGVDKISFLIIPNYHQRETIKDVCDEIKQVVGDGEIVLHGYTHLGNKFPLFSYKNLFTSYEGEFISFEDVEERLKRGLKMLEKCGLQPSGFIPPAWLMRKRDFKVLKNLGFRFTTDRRYLYDIVSGRKHFSPVISFSSRRFIEEMSVFYAYMAKNFINNINLVRIALHPPDINSITKMRLLKKILKESRHRKFITFAGYLNEVNLIKTK